MKKIILLALISFVCFSCKKEEGPVDVGTKLRLRNETPYQIESALIRLGTSENTYSSLHPNETSAYKSFSENSYPYIKLKINNKDVEFQIMPFEAPLVPTNNEPAKPMTCVITYLDASNSFSVHFTTD